MGGNLQAGQEGGGQARGLRKEEGVWAATGDRGQRGGKGGAGVGPGFFLEAEAGDWC